MGNRRDFLAKMGVVTAGISLGSIPAERRRYKPKAISANQKINVGLVGCSQRGVDQVWEGMQHLSEYRMVAICDVIPEQLEKAKARMPKEVRQYRDYRELVTQPDIDLVIVATPLKWHFEVSKAAILANKHVVCEKSMAKTVKEAVALEQLALSHKKSFKVSYEVRNNPAYITAKELVDKGVLGEIIHADCTWNRSSSWRRNIKNPDKVIEFPTGEKSTRERILNWRMSMEYGGGLMAEILCHPLDATEWILESGHVKSASGYGNIGYWKDGRDSFDNIHANLKYDNNLIISCNSILSNALEDYTISIYGRNATIKLGLGSGKLIPEAVQDYNKLAKEVDAITGATYKLVKKTQDRVLKPAQQDIMYTHYKQFVQGYILDTLIGYKKLALDLMAGKNPNHVKEGKYNSIACQLVNKAVHQGGIHKWKSEYGS
ncbi:MAG: Gfo/Idh/MocA family oxidoreductase [Bacteroidota bacterium]